MNNLEAICSMLPLKLDGAIKRVLKSLREPPLELHIVIGRGSSLRYKKGKIYLGVSLERGDIDAILSAFTGGALYAYRESLCDGYLTLFDGVRVGICGQARYEGERLVGVNEVTSLLIRFPCAECSFADELYRAFREGNRGMLIFAPAAGGKTTALRALVKLISENGLGRVSLIDERQEIGFFGFDSLDVDVFRGYRRSDGMQIALRVMSPQILAVDEIGLSEESEQMLDSLQSGVRFVATAHAGSLDEVKRRKNLAPFFKEGIFDVFAEIFHTDKGFECKIFKE